MELVWVIWLIDVFCSPSGSSGFGFLGGIGLLAWIVGGVFATMAKSDTDHNGAICSGSAAYLSTYRALWPAKFVVVLSILIGVFAPTKETAYTMLAAYGLQQVATNERVQEIGGKSLDLLESYIDKYTKEVGDNANSN